MAGIRRGLQVALAVPIIMLGTAVASSGIWNQPVPAGIPAASTPAFDHSISGGPTIANAWNQVPDSPVAPPPKPTPPPVPGGVHDVDVPGKLDGEFTVLPGSIEAPPAQRTITLTIEVEEGLPVDPAEMGEFVLGTLNHEKSWAKGGAIAFARTDSRPEIRVLLASPGTVDELCAPLQTNGRWSCGRGGRVVLNAERWINGADAFREAGGELVDYRRYLINHEIGHLLGHQHRNCPTPGAPAPVMAQQSIRMQGCEPNGWVHP